MRFCLLPLPVFLIVAGCSMGRVETHRPPAPVMRPMPEVFDCLRERRLALVSAHRGQKDPMAAENSIASFAETIRRGPIFIEVDIARSADGVLMLMHDQTLDRTTTGLGPLAGYTYQQLRRAWLKDGKGEITEERIPTLEEALIWARRNGAVLQLDIKPGTPLEEVLEHVREQRMENQVILIAYNLADVRNFQRAAPEMMVSASGRNAKENAAILAMANPRMLVFTGTLGAPGQRLDDLYLADGNGSEYADLAARGVALIATDQPVAAWRALKSADRDGTICLLGVKQ